MVYAECAATGIAATINCVSSYVPLAMPTMLFTLIIIFVGLLTSRGVNIREALPLTMVSLTGVCIFMMNAGVLIETEMIFMVIITFASIIWASFSGGRY